MLNSVIKIEFFIVNSLSTSNLIPLGVQILRLADDLESEGVLSGSNSIVVRYAGSNVNVKNKSPLVYERDMDFTIEYYCQSYLSESGHDFALQLMSAATQILTSQVPMGTGFQIVDSFTLSSESFDGLTDNSQYKYTQRWSLVVEEKFPMFALDPCVQRGNCEAVWPPKGVVFEINPWEVLSPINNEILAPLNSDGELEDIIVTLGDQSLVFRNSLEVISDGDDWKSWTFSPSDDSNIVVYDADGEFLKEMVYEGTGRFLPSLTDLESGFNVPMTSGKPLYVTSYKTRVVSDPMSYDPFSKVIVPGRALEINPDVRMEVRGKTYLLSTRGLPKESPWILESDVTLLPETERPGSECHE